MHIPIPKKVTELPMATVTDEGGSKWKVAQACLAKYYYTYEINNGEGITRGDSTNFKMLRGTAIHESLRWYYNILNGIFPNEIENKKPIDLGNKADIDRLLEVSILMGIKWVTNSNLDDVSKADLKDQIIQTIDLYHFNYEHELYHKDIGLTLTDTEKYMETVIDGDRLTLRIDGIGTYGGTPIIIDHKSTSKPWMHYLISLRKDLSLMGYVYVAREKLEQDVQMLVNGIIFKNTKAFNVVFERDIISYNQYHMDEYRRSLGKIHRDIDEAKASGIWPQNGQMCIKDFVICEFEELCRKPELIGSYEPRYVVKPTEEGGEN